MTLASSLTLPCGAVLPNRLSKAAMTEGLADPQGLPTPDLTRLYKIWAEGGAGMLLSGNIQIDADHLTIICGVPANRYHQCQIVSRTTEHPRHMNQWR